MLKQTLLFMLLFMSASAFGQSSQKEQTTEPRTFIEEIKDGDYFTMVYSFKDGFGYEVMQKNKILVSKKPKEGKGFASKEAAIKNAKEEVKLKKEKAGASSN